ncbi:FAD-dependent oxidoreductase [Streptomyces roseicoloratus]|uniref:FAD-dependent oxidoreductase n=1 Tax=Streptomyces roseicoloratus TaxID=2508722 RepID=A0ABY9RYB8_9ACTN|nr:FAD-dependent oxidoreductase [Streptomyces roseicoloratus]WMX47187.1 FAD-dependent oxidoreductase [Streptomyces roseicoloratus]
MSTRIVVVGGGTAGARLAQRLPVTLLGEEPYTPYNRLLLADVLAGRYGPEVIALPEPREPSRLGVRAVRIDRAARAVECADGSLVPYDRLVLATGSAPVLPPLRGLRGAELPSGVHPFRTLDDCLALRGLVRPGVRAVVIGGGLLGVSAARALAALGADVTLTQQGERLMERQLDEHSSALLRTHMEELGVEVHTECRVSGLRQRDGAVTAAVLADGFVLDAQVVVLACGVRPRVALAREAGLDVRTGVVVDDELRTSDPYIHAIGDCAEHDGRVYGLAGPALDQADVLAEVLAPVVAGDGADPLGVTSATGADGTDGAATAPGGPRYTGTRALTRLTLGGAADGLDLAAFGETTPAPGDDVVQLTDATRRAYRKVVVRGDRLVGGVLLGDLAAVGTLARAWEGDEALPDAPLLHLLTHDGGS